MKRRWQQMIDHSLWVLALLLIISPVSAKQERAVDKDLRQLMEMIQGEFNNYNQMYFQENGFIKVDNKTKYSHLHHYRQQIQSDDLPGHWIYAQINNVDKGNKVYRQTIWEFYIDDDDRIASRVWNFADKGMKEKGRPSIAFLNSLTKKQLKASQLNEACTTYWQKRGKQFVGAIDHKQCVIQSKYKDEKRQLFAEEIVFSDGVWMREGAYRLDGGLAFGLEEGEFYRYQKVRPMSCWVAINQSPGQDEYQDNGQWEYFKDLLTHDIGGELIVGKESPYRIQLKQTRFPVGEYKDVLEMFVFRGSEEKAFSYSWTDPQATMIGMNLREIQGACHLLK